MMTMMKIHVDTITNCNTIRLSLKMELVRMRKFSFLANTHSSAVAEGEGNEKFLVIV